MENSTFVQIPDEKDAKCEMLLSSKLPNIRRTAEFLSSLEVEVLGNNYSQAYSSKFSRFSSNFSRATI